MTRHNSFPIVSMNLETFRGTVQRQYLQLVLWHIAAHTCHEARVALETGVDAPPAALPPAIKPDHAELPVPTFVDVEVEETNPESPIVPENHYSSPSRLKAKQQSRSRRHSLAPPDAMDASMSCLTQTTHTPHGDAKRSVSDAGTARPQPAAVSPFASSHDDDDDGIPAPSRAISELHMGGARIPLPTLRDLVALKDKLFFLPHLPFVPSKYLSPDISDSLLDLNPYIDISAMSVNDATPIEQAHRLFLKLTVRHVIVVNRTNQVVGMLTRKDLANEVITVRLERSLQQFRQLNGDGSDGDDPRPAEGAAGGGINGGPKEETNSLEDQSSCE
jgi:hypothetical protein